MLIQGCKDSQMTRSREDGQRCKVDHLRRDLGKLEQHSKAPTHLEDLEWHEMSRDVTCSKDLIPDLSSVSDP